MRPTYKNALFMLLSTHEFGVASFEYKEDFFLGKKSSVITYGATPFNFYITDAPDSYDRFRYSYSLYAPNFPVTPFFPEHEDYCTFNVILAAFSNWLSDHLKKFTEDLSVPDLWKDYLDQGKLISIQQMDFGDRRRFSIDEKRRLSFAIRDLKYLIQDRFQTREEQQQMVDERLDYLVESMEQLNKFDWKSVVVSIIFSIIVALTLDTEKGRELFALFNSLFSLIPRMGNG